MNKQPEDEESESSENFNPATMFAEVLERDLANIVKKSAAGSPLTKREREMIEQALAQQAAPPASSSHSIFSLESTTLSPLSGLTQIEIAEKWGYSHRQIKTWIADGRSASDPCPLTQPADMPAWFARIYAPRSAPDRLIQAARALLTSPNSEAPPTSSAVPKRLEVSDAEKGILAMLERMRTAEATMHARYLERVDAGEKDKADYLFSEWGKIVEKLRALEKSAPSSLAEAGIYVRKDDVTRELMQIHAGIIKSFKQAIRKARLTLQSCANTEDFHRAADDLVDSVCKELVETDFKEPLELE